MFANNILNKNIGNSVAESKLGSEAHHLLSNIVQGAHLCTQWSFLIL